MRNIAIICMLSALMSCGSLQRPGENSMWTVKKTEFGGLGELSIKDVPPTVVENIKADYKQNPKDASYAELSLAAAYYDQSTDHNILIFDILYIDDIQVVYVVAKDGDILDKYLRSSWN